MGVKGPAVAFTLWPERVPFPKGTTATRPALAASDLQPVERDFAFVVDAGVEALTLVNAAAGADKALIDERAGVRRVPRRKGRGADGRGQEDRSPSPCGCSRARRP